MKIKNILNDVYITYEIDINNIIIQMITVFVLS